MLYLVDISHRFYVCPVVNRGINKVGRVVWSVNIKFVTDILDVSRIMITNVMNGSHTESGPVLGRDMSDT